MLYSAPPEQTAPSQLAFRKSQVISVEIFRFVRVKTCVLRMISFGLTIMIENGSTLENWRIERIFWSR